MGTNLGRGPEECGCLVLSGTLREFGVTEILTHICKSMGNTDGESRRGQIFIRMFLEAMWSIVYRTAKQGQCERCWNGADRRRWIEAIEKSDLK